MKPVLVFKTSVTNNADVRILKPQLDKLIRQGERWNFDLEDCDNILRVESAVCNADQIKELVQVAGFVCEELQ